ncbi:hypothetical protein N7508_005172 [Penicillium antarcticum]|uniref:uncharacterized protein n=1 Tax=Penicillium antarcticum TaxID=416450 RepID=UPI0023974057|nr:uncharacterized protein N7508_005172 [Penicillium antarcticum]KAJ5306157.1 hypothetical protein N7508_005172 [Penicillium antarcticum]
MTRTVACMSCAKRKVRCDRQEPCSHCKRRKKEDCTYPGTSPAVRVRHLEALVRRLGHSPDGEEVASNDVPAEASSTQTRHRTRSSPTQDNRCPRRNSPFIGTVPNNDPAVVEEDGERVYLEASTWHSWDQRPRRTIYSQASQQKTSMRACIPTQPSLSALQNIIQPNYTIEFARRHPASDIATVLWRAYNRNVNPLVKIAFQWELDQMRTTSLSNNSSKEFLPQEHALFFSIYLNSVASLSEKECLESIGQQKQYLLSEYRMLLENALARADFLGRSELILVQASIFYISASLDDISTRSLWSFMGIVVRHAERLGLHRDGTILNMTPTETEKRRRIWWQLQHLDIALAVRSGSISLVLMADWDVKMPLNIEDEDISPTAIDFPPERKGLTSMSYCLWTYYVLEKQRSFRRPDGSRVGGSWQADRTLPRRQRKLFIDELEDGINDTFVRFCDPIKPLDLLILIVTRSFTWGMRRLILHSDELTSDASDYNDSYEKDLLAACSRCLEYDIYLHSQRIIERFYWRTTSFFPWHAFVYVISEASRYCEGTEETWDLLSRLYSANSHLRSFKDDKRKPRAAELILTAWQAYESSYAEHRQKKPQRPIFLSELETLLIADQAHVSDANVTLSSSPRGTTANALRQEDSRFAEKPETRYPDAEKIPAADSALNFMFDLDSNEIDWSFWRNWE